MNHPHELEVDLRQMILAIETAVSLVGMNDTNHGKRVGYIASQIGHELGFADADLQYAFELGLLHDCGVSTAQMHASLVNYFDWNDAHIHCEIGHRLLRDFEPLACFALPVLHHHTHWSDLVEAGLTPRDARMANLIFLSDRVDVRAAGHYGGDILLARDDIVDSVAGAHRGSFFDSELVDALLRVQRSEAFWIALEDRHIVRYTWDMGQMPTPRSIPLDKLRQLSMIMAYIVDQKSPFTARHSVGVADLARSSPTSTACPRSAASRSRSPACCTTWASCTCRTASSKKGLRSTGPSARSCTSTVSRPTKSCAISRAWATSRAGPPTTTRG